METGQQVIANVCLCLVLFGVCSKTSRIRTLWITTYRLPPFHKNLCIVFIVTATTEHILDRGGYKVVRSPKGSVEKPKKMFCDDPDYFGFNYFGPFHSRKTLEKAFIISISKHLVILKA